MAAHSSTLQRAVLYKQIKQQRKVKETSKQASAKAATVAATSENNMPPKEQKQLEGQVRLQLGDPANVTAADDNWPETKVAGFGFLQKESSHPLVVEARNTLDPNRLQLDM